MNKQRLEWHRERQASNAAYFRKLNASKMREWLEVWEGIDRSDPAVLDLHAVAVSDRAIRLLNAAAVLEGERREGALLRASRFLREARALEIRAAALRRGEKPLDEWATCRCGSAFQPGPRGYTQCYNCSQKDWIGSSYSCVFCDRRHSMSYSLCFMCTQARTEDGKPRYSEDDARFVRLMVHQRDHYRCQMCGIDAMETGAELQVHRIDPEGGNWPWNQQTMCTTCDALVGKSYDKLDERSFWALVQAYGTYLFDYLQPDEKAALLALEPDTEHEQIDFGKPVTQPWSELREFGCQESDGLLNVLASFGAQVVHD